MTIKDDLFFHVIQSAARLAANWKSERIKFLQYATPFWQKNGGDALVAHMREEYVMVETDIISQLHCLDADNKEILLRYLAWS